MIEKTTWFQLQPLYNYVRRQSENRQFLRYIEIGSTLFLIAIFLFFAIMPTASDISSLIGEINSKKTLSSAMSAKLDNIMQAQESFSQIQADYSVLESSYPSLPNFYQSAKVFSYISKESSTPIKQIHFQLNNEKTDSNNNQDTFSVGLDTTGSYYSIISSIEKISSARRLIDIKSIQITSNSPENSLSSSQLNLNISANLYYLPPIYAQK